MKFCDDLKPFCDDLRLWVDDLKAICDDLEGFCDDPDLCDDLKCRTHSESIFENNALHPLRRYSFLFERSLLF